MQELRLVAVSEDGIYAVLEVPGRSGRFVLPIDDRLRIVARGQFSRLAQYEIEVENPLRPKEIQDRIRAGETAEEIADVSGIPIERIRRFEGPVLAERAYRAQEAQGATIRRAGESGPGRQLGEVVTERLRALGASLEEAEWDSRKRADGTWMVQVAFTAQGQPQLAEWVFDPQRRHVTPADDPAARLSLPEEDLPRPVPAPRGPVTATVTPIATRLNPAPAPEAPPRARPEPRSVPAQPRPAAREAPPAARETRPAAGEAQPAAREARPAAAEARPAAAAASEENAAQPPPQAQPSQPARPARKAAGGRSRRSSVPSWDEIMFGTSRQPE
ncbi:MAG: septation protein SepH [Gemmatimonadota bacterium]